MKLFEAKSSRSGVILTLAIAGQLLAGTVAGAATDKTLSYALSTEPPQLNSLKATDAESFFIIGHTMEGLLRYGKGGDLVPGVAEKWTINDKGASFTLRKNAKWSDGKPVTAHDFVTAWRGVVDPKTASEYAFIMYPLKNAEQINKGHAKVEDLGVVAKDDYTLQVTFEKPCGYFLGLTAFGVYMPVRADFLKAQGERYGADARNLLFNGPYKLAKWVHGASLQMVKNENYWNAGAIDIQTIDIPYITPDNSARFNFFKDHKIDVLQQLGKDDLPKAQAERMSMKTFSDGTLFYMEFNHRAGKPTANVHLRRAIQEMFNQGQYVQTVVAIPGTKPGRGVIPSWVKGVKHEFRKEYPVPANKMDLSAAKKELELARKELGGSIPPLVWLTGDTPASSREAEYFQSEFKKNLGIDLRIDKQIFKQRLAKMTAGEFDIVSAGWGPDFNDPMTFAELWTSWNENNRGQFRDAEYDRHIRNAQSTANQKVRMDNMAAAEKIAVEKVAIVPLYERAVVYVFNNRVQGIVRRAVGFDPDFTTAKLLKK
jgi:oligopeptide transport system substrate-binding protein